MIDRSVPAANDNATGDDERPIVAIPDDHRDHAYARRGNLILPLRFALRMLGCPAERIELTGGAKRG
jgi:hypothetical protein